jgi:uncharacterized protein YcfJ
MKTLTTTTLIFTTALITATSGALADSANHYDYARVTHATPVYEQIAQSRPQQQCWVEPVAYEAPSQQHRSATGTIVGTLIGAAVGHQIGRNKDGKQVGRIAGAVLGGSIGRDASAAARSGRVVYRDEERCETTYSTYYEQQLVGYDVTYQYHGRTYHARTDRNPGAQIKVAVAVSPVF